MPGATKKWHLTGKLVILQIMQRRSKPELVQAVCSQRCAYYKSGRNEELACQGYIVLERLATTKGIPLARNNDERPRDGAGEELLMQALCVTCPFHEKDCDFMENRALPPCGGFLLLMQLLAAKDLSIDDVKKNLPEK
jgi:hypothetical protein